MESWVLITKAQTPYQGGILPINTGMVSLNIWKKVICSNIFIYILFCLDNLLPLFEYDSLVFNFGFSNRYSIFGSKLVLLWSIITMNGMSISIILTFLELISQVLKASHHWVVIGLWVWLIRSLALWIESCQSPLT